MPKYQVYLIKKVAQLEIIEADDHHQAEDIGYDLLERETFENPYDSNWDRYVYVDKELENA